jgi:fido (protein-threonine AMPylation protein)
MVEFARATTESQLREWRLGQVGAERLAAAILHLDGFTEIDPQAPLGGSDDRKDILCIKGSTKYIGAAYFPTTEKTFAEIKDKFEHDLEGTARHDRQALAFITNQSIGLTGRSKLEAIAARSGKIAMLYHRERIRVLLDSPAGYGVRLQFLGIAMNEAEQLAYFASSGNKLEYALEHQAREIRNLARRIELLYAGQNFAVHTIHQIATNLGEEVPLPPNLDTASGSDRLEAEVTTTPVSAAITPGLLLFVHRIVCSQFPLGFVGKFRDRTVWVGGPTPEDARYVAPPPDEVPKRLQGILSGWNHKFPELKSASSSEKLNAVAEFHHRLLALHPFLDGNGRVARTLLAQQCIDLFGRIDPALLDRGADYYLALQSADEGDLARLRDLIDRAINL